MGHLEEIINGQSVLNKYGLLVKREIDNIYTIRKECVVEKFVIMPNHIHLIVRIVGDDGNRPVGGNRPAQFADHLVDANRTDEPGADCPKSRADCHPPLLFTAISF